METNKPIHLIEPKWDGFRAVLITRLGTELLWSDGFFKTEQEASRYLDTISPPAGTKLREGMTMDKDFTTRNTRGAIKMANHGQKVPFWMGCYNGLDDMVWKALERWRKYETRYLHEDRRVRLPLPSGVTR